MSPSVEPLRGGVYARRAVGALSRRYPDVTSSAYCVRPFRRANASGVSWTTTAGACAQLEEQRGDRIGE